MYKKIAALPDSAKHKTVYMELGNKGIGEYGNSYNKDVLWGAILKNLGADNLAENATQPYAPLDTEFVLASNPQLIVIGGGIWPVSYTHLDVYKRQGPGYGRSPCLA